MNEKRHGGSHDRVTLVGIVPLATVVSQRDPIGVLTDDGKKVRSLGIRREMCRMTFDMVACRFERVGNALPAIVIGEERELMRRLRRRELP